MSKLPKPAPAWRGTPEYADRPLTVHTLLRLMHFVKRDAGQRCRPLVVVGGGYGWLDKPERPMHPGNWPFRRIPSSLDDGLAAEYTAHDVAKNRHDDHDHYWPNLPPKTVRRMIRRGWLAGSSDAPGILSVTPEGRAAYFMARLGHPEGESPPSRPRRSRKRRPQGAALMFSRYRWHVEGRNRYGSTPRPAPHVAQREMERRNAASRLAD